MAKARNRRRPTTTTTNGRTVARPPRAAPVGRPASQRQAARRSTGRPRWRVAVAVVALAVGLGLGGWWAYTALQEDGEEETGTAGSTQPIATLNSPDVHSLAIDPRDANHVFFGSHAGIKESQDGGFGWKDGTLKNADAMSLAVSPEDPTTVYAAGHDVFFVSRDGGQNWQPLQHNLPGTDIHAFAQDPSDPKRLFAFVVGGGVFASTDGGTTWAPLPAQPPGGSPIALATNGVVLYAATQAGLVVSRDQGTTWEQLPTQPSGGAISLAVLAVDPQLVYAGTPSGLAKSTDGGQNWIGLGPQVPVIALAGAPSDSARVLFVSEGGAVYRSDDGGATWQAPS